METFYQCLLIGLLGILPVGALLYFLISLLVYMEDLEEEKQKKAEMDKLNEKDINHDDIRKN